MKRKGQPKGRAARSRLAGQDPVIEHLLRRGLPLMLEHYMAFAYMDDPNRELSAEEVANLPPVIRQQWEKLH